MHSKPQAEHMRIKPQFREELTPILNLSPPPPKKKKNILTEEGTHPNSFYEATPPHYQNQRYHTKRKL